jgi:DNA polymerase-1
MTSINPDCQECGLYATANTVCMAGDGPKKNVKVMVIGEAPGAQEDKRGVPFIGESGRILRNELQKNDLIEDTYITNLVKCRPPKNRTPTAVEIKACRHYLDDEIAELNPAYVVTAGVPATKTLFRGRAKINQFHGEVIENPKVNYVGMPIFHPAYTLRDPSKLPGLQDDIARLARLIESGLRNDTVEWSVVRKGNLDTFMREFKEAPEFAYDCETSGLFPFDEDGYVTAVGIAFAHKTWVIPGLMHPDYQRFSHSPFASKDALGKLMRLLFAIAHRSKKRTYAQNGKFDNKWFRCKFGGSFWLTFDTMLAHHVLDENLAHDLTSMCRTHLDEPEYDIPLAEKQGKSEKPVRNYKYCAQDAAYTFRLGKLFEQMLREQPSLHRLYWKITMPGARAMEDAEMEGLTVDEPARKEIGLQLLSQKITAREDLNDMAGYEVNWNSPQQIARLLYEELGLTCKVFTAKKAKSTSEEALSSLKHPVVTKLLEFRGADKNFNVYIKGWQKYRVGDQYFFDYKLHGTVTGRYSSPLHPIPRDGKIRNLITAPEGWTLCALDIATAEMRIAAHLSRDPEMMRCFVDGIDVHWRTMIENLSISKESEWTDKVWVTAERLKATRIRCGRVSYSDCLDIMLEAGPKACIKAEPKWYDGRTRAKAINFGFIFGMYEKKFIEQAKKDYDWEPSFAEAKNARRAYFRLYSRLDDWHHKTKRLARANGYVRCLTGRLRRLPGIHAKDKMVRMEAERQAVNSGVQAMIGDYKAMILIQIHQTFPREKVRLVGEHHDAVLTIVKNEYIDECVPKMLKMAKRPKLMKTFKIKLNVPMEGEAELGPWGRGVKYDVAA